MSGDGAATARERAMAAFEREYGRTPTHLAWGPGRVNLIGEHTDYNDGFVLPMALEARAYVAFRPRGDGSVNLRADDLDRAGSFELRALGSGAPSRLEVAEPEALTWLDYPKGVAWALERRFGPERLSGFDGVLASDVPRGAGLSSSAAVELAVAMALLAPAVAANAGSARTRATDGIPTEGWDARAVARAAQLAENEWVGVASGIMDQLVSAAAVKGSALLIDCRDLSLTPVPLPAGVAVAVLDTGTRRGLAGSAYNDRRAACERVAAALGVRALRDVDPGQLERAAATLDPTDLNRARHVVLENERTLAAARALEGGDAATFGRLMNESHTSLRDLYEVSSGALDAMVEAARAAPGCLGARMTGAGFGGCAVALVAADAASAFIEATASAYEDATGHAAQVYLSAAGGGAGTSTA